MLIDEPGWWRHHIVRTFLGAIIQRIIPWFLYLGTTYRWFSELFSSHIGVLETHKDRWDSTNTPALQKRQNWNPSMVADACPVDMPGPAVVI